jgi:hypothetical protein
MRIKKIIAVVAFVTMQGLVNAQPVQQKISEKVMVTFPGKPEEQKPGGDSGPIIYTFTDKDSANIYMAMNFDLSAMGLTPEVVTSMGDALWEQMKPGMVAKWGGAVIIKDEKRTIKDKELHYIEVDGTNSAAPNLKGRKAFMYIFFMGAALHQIGFYLGSKDVKEDAAKLFFDSIVIEK